MFESWNGWEKLKHSEQHLILDVALQLLQSPGSNSVEIDRVEREFGYPKQEFLDILGKLRKKNLLGLTDDNRVMLKDELRNIFDDIVHRGRRR